MKALRFHKTGSLDNLKIVDIPKPRPASGEALVQIKAAAVNPSDVKNVLGKMHETSVPRVPRLMGITRMNRDLRQISLLFALAVRFL
jgi:NADPH:quinone reductase-like Zn-dependent oxidoreductase